jgi:hypothetical protein
MTIPPDLRVQQPADGDAGPPKRDGDWYRLSVVAALIIVLAVFGVLAMCGVKATTIEAVSAATAAVLTVVLAALGRGPK